SRVRMAFAYQRKRLEELGNAFARIEVPEAAEEWAAFELSGRHVGDRPGRMRNPPQRPVVAAFACALLDVPRVRDQAGRVREHLAGERELVGPGLPDRCHAAVENTVREQATGNACVTLHRCEVAGPVLVADRQAGDEM